MLFAGASFGQLTCTGATQALNPAQPILDRAESQTELVSDVVILCPNGAVVSNGQLTVFASLPITSKAVPTVTAGTYVGTAGNSEATLVICAAQPAGTGCITPGAAGGTAVGGSVFYQGTVSGSTISFSGITFPGATFTMEIANVRVNASSAAIGGTPTAVTESIFAGTNGLATYVQNGITVGYVLQSLVNPAFTPNSIGFRTPVNYVVCTGNPQNTISASSISMEVQIAETFGGFFKTQTGVPPAGPPVVVQNGEQGTLQLPAASAAIGTAASGTNISLTFGNLPSVSTIYVPTTITFTPAGGVASTLTLTPAATPVTGQAGLTGATANFPAPAGTVFGGFAAFTPSSGALTVTYQVTASSAAQVEIFNVPVYVAFAANAAAAQGPITVLESYTPAGTLSGLPTTVPFFAASTATPLNGTSITLCRTNLLFPFITNNLGFDTGIVLTNASTDTLGAAGATSVAAQSGTCTLSFFGTGAPTPSAGVADPLGATTSGTTHAFVLSSIAPGFQGYAIATCPFLYAHGFAYIAYNLTQNNGAAMGYLAEVMVPNGVGTRTVAGSVPEGITF